MSRLLVLGLGYGFLVLGVLGLFLPVLQGVLFLVVGLVILSRHAPWAERLLARFKARFPRLGSVFTTGENLAERWIHKLGRRVRGS
ncbi:MAG: PGPGW domain-containing protein [Geminicoccaceae bacterium]|nr:hypothetical protein [Geminicoccaceae bacterium]HRY22738.1 PGPGW domain-containing protein [Geminicoccaceae bacterium]